ncbi:MAG: ABC transporter ATP-binding protein [Candidatus Omnitrophota bacterium]
MSEFSRLLKFVKPHRAEFNLAIVFMVLSAFLENIQLAMMIPILDKVFSNRSIVVSVKLPDFLNNLIVFLNGLAPLEMIKLMVIVIPVLILIKGVVTYFHSYFMSDIGQLVVRDIRNSLYKKIQSLSLEYFTHKRGGEIMSRITNDVRLVENAVSYGITDLVYQSSLVVLYTFWAFYINWKIAAISFILLPLISFPIIKVGKILRKLSEKAQIKMADISSLLYETILGVRIVKAFSMENYEIEKFGRNNQDYYKIAIKSIKRNLFLGPLTEFIGAIIGVFLLYWGGREVIAGRMSFGTFSFFLACLLMLIRPFKKLSQVNSINQQALAASRRIHEVLDTQPKVVETGAEDTLPKFDKDIVFKGVSFRYEQEEVLSDIDLEIHAGEVVAIVGPSGVGKSTLVDLIPRFYDPQKGEILINGFNLKEVTLKSLRREIGIVTQETILFNDTIKANIAYGNPQVSIGKIMEAAQKAYAHEFISKLPLGYDTLIGDRGMKLSGGERQRIAIARALLKDPSILILDEATSQLDSASEKIVQQALDSLIANRTVFIVAHRLSTVRNATRIVVMDKGRIKEIGSHEELLKKGGLYQRLYQLQLEQ